MAFDDATRGAASDTSLATPATLLTDEFTKQFQQDYGLDPRFGRCRCAGKPGASR